MVMGAMVFAISAAASAETPKPDLRAIAIRYVHAQQAVMERSASSVDVVALLDFYTDDYTYYHPQYGAKVTGADAHRGGVESHLGETAKPRITVKGIQVIGDIVSLSTVTQFTVVSDGNKVIRPGVWVLTFRGDKIAQRVDVTPLKPAT